MVDDTVVEVFTAEMGITGGREDLENTFVDGEEGNIEGTTSEIVDDDLAFAARLVESVGDRSGGGFVDDTQDVETRDGSGVLGRLALSVVEAARSRTLSKERSDRRLAYCYALGGDGDDRVQDLLTEVRFGRLLHLSENHGRDFLRGERPLLAALDFDLDDRLVALLDDLERVVLQIALHVRLVEFPADQTLGVEDSAARLGQSKSHGRAIRVDELCGVLRSLVLRRIADQTLSIGGECNIGRSNPVTLLVEIWGIRSEISRADLADAAPGRLSEFQRGRPSAHRRKSTSSRDQCR